MSHFLVLVIGDDVNAALAPFRAHDDGSEPEVVGSSDARCGEWVIGGAWSGLFPTLGGGTADSARKCEIDWSGARDAAEARARASFALWRRALDTHPAEPEPRSWEQMCGEHGGDAERTESAFRAQPQIAAWDELVDPWAHSDVDPVSEYGFDVEAYVARVRRRVGLPFAFVVDGAWHESQGDVDAWCEEWERAWDALPDDARVTAVDCHS
jgi:hypothetical protein